MWHKSYESLAALIRWCQGTGKCREKSHSSPKWSLHSSLKGTQSSAVRHFVCFIVFYFCINILSIAMIFPNFKTFINPGEVCWAWLCLSAISCFTLIKLHKHFACSPFLSDVLRNIMSAGILWFYKKRENKNKSANGSVLLSTVAKAFESSWIIKQGQYLDQRVKEKYIF